MAGWLCIKCLHQFPDENVRKKPEYVGMAIFVVLGGGLVLFALGCLFTFLTAGRSADMLVYAALSALFGAGLIGLGISFGKGTKAICPACGKSQGVREDSKIADEVRRRGKPY
jgi:hypothetical protein